MGKKNEKAADPALTTSDLEKSLAKLEEYADSATPETRKQALLSKAMGDDISEEESEELRGLLGGGSDQQTLAKSATAMLDQEQVAPIKKALDISEYLSALHEGLSSSIEQMSEYIEKSDRRQQEFNVVLARAVKFQGELVKSLVESIDSWASQPVGGPRAVRSNRQPLEKGMRNGQDAPAGDKLSKSQVMDLLDAMHVQSLKDGRGGMALCGEDLNKAVAKYETTLQLSRPVYKELMQFQQTLRAQRAARANGAS